MPFNLVHRRVNEGGTNRVGGSRKAKSTFTGIFTASSQVGSTLWRPWLPPFEKILYTVFELKVKIIFLYRKFFQIFYVLSQHHCTLVQDHHCSYEEPERGQDGPHRYKRAYSKHYCFSTISKLHDDLPVDQRYEQTNQLRRLQEITLFD